MHILPWVLTLIWIPTVTASSDHNRLRELVHSDEKKDVPSLSLFIPPPQLVSIVTDGIKNSSAPKSVRQNLIVDPLLALLNEEEANLLQLLLPGLFPTKNNNKINNNNQTKTKIVKQESAERIGSTSPFTTTQTSTTLDPILNWLLNGPSTDDDVTTPSPTAGPMITMTDDMLISMLQQAVNLSPTPTPASTTETVRWTGPVGIGDDLLATLLKSLQEQTEKSSLSVTESSAEKIAAVTAVTVTPSLDTSLLDTLTTKASDLKWPDKVKPGGGISDEAIAAIIRDVNNIDKNISVLTAESSNDFLDEKPVTISDDQVAQLIHDVEVAVNTSTPQSEEIKDEKVKTSSGKSKKVTKAKNSGNVKTSGGGKKGSKSPNRLRKRPGRKPTRVSVGKPNLWERLVKAASNAIFGEKKPQKGLFQVDDILDLLTNL